MKVFLPEQTRISQVHLRTARPEGAVAFYADVLGLRLLHRPGSHATLSATGAGPGLLVLTEDLNAPPCPPRSTGLYHFAIRYPRREDLAHAYYRLVRSDYPVAGASDHGVSEAIYLSDPEGNSVELYVDRPRSQWNWRNGQVAMTTEPLDFDSLLASTEGQPGPSKLPPQTDLGHIHLNVADLTAAERFYHEFLGLAVTQSSYPGALFLSAGGYHHHLGGRSISTGQQHRTDLVSPGSSGGGNSLLSPTPSATRRLRGDDTTRRDRLGTSSDSRPERPLAGSAARVITAADAD